MTTLNGLTYASYEKTLYGFFEPKVNKSDLSRLLLASAMGKDGKHVTEKIDDSVLSYYRTGKRTLSETVMFYYETPDVLARVTAYFAENITPHVPVERRYDLTAKLMSVIDADPGIAEAKKADFKAKTTSENMNGFLAEVFVCAVKRGAADADTGMRKKGAFPFNNLPYLRNAHFTGREEVLARIRKQLRNKKTVSLTQTISGLGGVGKTQTALEFAYRFARGYDVIWWLPSETQKTLSGAAAEFVVRSDKIEVPADEAAIRGAFVSEFENSTGWLLIYDNVDDYDAVVPFLPKGGIGDILTTSRLTRGFIGEKTDIDVFGENEAVMFLRNRTGLNDGENAAKLAIRLGFLPLALEQAAAYIFGTPGSDFVKYLSLLDEFGLAVLEQDETITDYKSPVTATWKISLEKIGMESARQLLNLCAFFAPDGIDLAMLAEYREHLPEPLRDDILNALARDRIVREITKYSLVKYRDGALSLHRLLQEVIRADTGNDTAALIRCLNIAKDAVATIGDDRDARAVFLRRAPHADAAARHAETNGAALKTVADVYLALGRGFLRFGDYEQALDYFSKTLVLRKNSDDEDTESAAALCRNMGLAYKCMGESEKALGRYHDGVAIFERAGQTEHPDVAALYNNIANVHKNDGAYARALEYYQKSLDIKLKTLGEKHPDTVMTQSNTANVYKRMGETQKALESHMQVKDLREEILGTVHKDTAATYGNIALLYGDMGRYDEALEWFERTLKIQEETQGEEHPDTAMTHYNIAAVLKHKGECGEAMRRYETALLIQIKKLGPKHPDTILTQKDMRACKKALGNRRTRRI
ncbi:MAG: tetratricopeptide repeat protein [Treponema sp.]|jgi:tetratricopeptide (TPR) repeat protein|nr:tetratricopeptide repeat protein [Treponema sp.]